MNRFLLILAGGMLVTACHAQPTLPANFVVTKPRGNVCLVFFLQDSKQIPTNTPVIPVETRLGYTFASTISTNYDVSCLKAEYAGLLAASADSGAEVKKTRKGRKWGKRFFDVTALDRRMLSREGGGQFPYLAVAGPRPTTAYRWLPPLSELFEFEKPGIYEVFIVLQCFVQPWDRSTPTRPTLVRFPPVRIRVQKQPEP